MMALWLMIDLTFASPDRAAFSSWVEGLPVDQVVPSVAKHYGFASHHFLRIHDAMADRPGVVEVEQIGTTPEDAPIWAFHIREPGLEIQERVLVFANMHAMEWIGTEVALDLAIELIAHPPRGTRVTIIPILNPDGRAKVERDLLDGRTTYRRGNQANIDLNRDFSVHRNTEAIWEPIIPGYYQTSPDALSQPESQALDTLLSRERFDRAASLHAFGGFFYTPWSGRFERPDDFAEYLALGRDMERAQGGRAYKTRQLARWGFFFRALGSEIDHMHGTYGVQAYLIELTRSGINPFVAADWKTPFRWYNPRKPRRHQDKGVSALRILIQPP